jgi:CO/xanthine dehydrogenase Mo-binding subunit
MTPWSSNATTIAGSPIGLSGDTSTYLNSPLNVFVYNSSTIYVLDSNNYRVQLFHSNSMVGTTVVNGSSGSALNQFSSSYCIIR